MDEQALDAEVAHHEAGHAVLHFVLGVRQTRATIKPDRRRGSLGHVAIRRPRWFVSPATPQEDDRRRLRVEDEIISLYAGRIAQSKYTGKDIDWGYEDDYHSIVNLVSQISYHDDVSRPFLQYCEAKTRRLVEAHWPDIQAVAAALIEHKSLTASRIREVIQSVPVEVIQANLKRLQEAHEREQEALLAEYRRQHPDEN